MISRHTSDEVSIAVITHCSVHARSDSSAWEFRGECDRQHCYECERCESLEGLFREVAEMQDKSDMTEEERVRLSLSTLRVRATYRRRRVTCYGQVPRKKPSNIFSRS